MYFRREWFERFDDDSERREEEEAEVPSPAAAPAGGSTSSSSTVATASPVESIGELTVRPGRFLIQGLDYTVKTN
jgi:hypothetical protein